MNNRIGIYSLPPDMTNLLLSNLDPKSLNTMSCVSNKLKYTAGSDLVWYKKFLQHFPHHVNAADSPSQRRPNLFSSLKKGEGFWKQAFEIAKAHDFASFSKTTIHLFSLVKENDAVELEKILQLKDLDKNNQTVLDLFLADLYKKDKSDKSLLDWALEKGSQAMLDLFYKLAIKEYQQWPLNTVNVSKRNAAGLSALNLAIVCRQKAAIKSLIEQGANLAPDHYFHPLGYAVKYRYLEIVDLLLEHDKNMNANAALILAVQNNHFEIVKSILEKGTNHNDAHVKALDHAAKCGYFEIVKLLLEKHNDINADSALIHALQNNHFEIAKSLLGLGAAVNIVIDRTQTALAAAAENGNFEMVQLLMPKLLLAKEKQNEILQLAILKAAKSGSREILDYLLQKGAEINENNRCAILLQAVDGGQDAMVEYLLEKIVATEDMLFRVALAAAEKGHLKILMILLKRNPEIQNRFRRNDNATAMSFAAQNGHLEVVEALLDYEEGPCSQVIVEAFLNAAKHGRLEVVKAFIGHIANIHTIHLLDKNDNEDVTALILAVQNNQLEVVEALLQRENNVINAVDARGATALYYAVKNRNFEMAKTLLKCGADINAKKDGPIPLHKAVKNYDYQMVDLLLSHNKDNLETSTKIDTVVEGTSLSALAKQKGNPDIIRAIEKRKKEIDFLEYREKISVRACSQDQRQRYNQYKIFNTEFNFSKVGVKMGVVYDAETKKNAAGEFHNFYFFNGPKPTHAALNSGNLGRLTANLMKK